MRHIEPQCHAVSLRRASRGQKAVCNPEICLEKMVYVSSLSGFWGGAPAANNFAAFWTEMEASGAMISSNVCSFMDDAFIRLDFQPVVMDFILGM